MSCRLYGLRKYKKQIKEDEESLDMDIFVHVLSSREYGILHNNSRKTGQPE